MPLGRCIGIVFCVLITLIGAAANAATWTEDTLPSDPYSIALPSFGVQIDKPAEWVPIKELKFGHAARFLRLDPEQSQAMAIVELEFLLAGESSAKAQADLIANQMGGQAQASTVKLGGSDTWQVDLPGPADDIAPRRVLITEHGGLIYRLSLICRDVEAESEAFAQIAQSVIWLEIVSPYKALSFDRPDVSLFGSGLMVNMPDPMRPDKVENPESEMFFGIQDVQTGKPDLMVNIQYLNLPPDSDTKMVATSIAASQSEQLGIDPVPVDEIPNDLPTYLWQIKVGPNDSALVLCGMPEDQAMLLIFQVMSEDPEAVAAYKEAIVRIAASLRFSNAYAESHEAAQQPSP